MAPPTMSELLRRHKSYQTTYQAMPNYEEMIQAGGRLPYVAIITCADPRCTPETFLNLQTGDAAVLRIPGGGTREFLPHLIAIDFFARFQEVMVIQHTDCGACAYRDEDLKKMLRNAGTGNAAEIDGMSFGEITTSMEENVDKNVKLLRESPYLRKELRKNIHGFIFDIKTGDLKQM